MSGIIKTNMRIYTFFADVIENRAYIRDKKEINHAKNVLRLKVGDSVRIIDGSYEYSASISNISSQEMSLDIENKEEDRYSLVKDIDAYVGIVKNDAMHEIITHLTEIGINSFIPLVTRYSLSKINREKLEKITREAAKQCLAVKGMKILKEAKLKDINFKEYDLVIFGKERSEDRKISDLKNEIKKANKIAFIVGPEGGFEDVEKEFLDKNTKSITLGNRIYRAETASIVIAGIIKEFI